MITNQVAWYPRPSDVQRTKARHRLPNGFFHRSKSNMADSMVSNGTVHKWAYHGLIRCVTFDFLSLIARNRPYKVYNAWISKWLICLMQFCPFVFKWVGGSSARIFSMCVKLNLTVSLPFFYHWWVVSCCWRRFILSFTDDTHHFSCFEPAVSDRISSTYF